jgi:hypothetical protein
MFHYKFNFIRILFIFCFLCITPLRLFGQGDDEIDFEKIEEDLRKEEKWIPLGDPKLFKGKSIFDWNQDIVDKIVIFQVEKEFYWKMLTRGDSLTFSFAILLLPSQTSAFGFYSVEKSPSQKFFNIGFQSYLIGQRLVVWYGRIVLVIEYSDSDQVNDKPIRKFAENFVDILPAQRRQTPILDSLPEKNRVRHSEKYTKLRWLGQNYFKNIYYADYYTQEGFFRIFIIDNKTTATADSNFWNYYSFMKNNGGIMYEEIPVSTDYYVVIDPLWGKTILTKKNQIIYGVLDFRNINWTVDRLDDILNELKKRKIVKSG